MQRFALYYAPQSGSPLAKAASTWLGRDNESFNYNQLKPSELDGERFYDLTRAPYHYGFHGTLKPPFRLGENVAETHLFNALKLFCLVRKPFTIKELKLSWIGKFFCLRPAIPAAQLNNLARDVVLGFDRFREKMDSVELEKRRSKDLTQAQDDLLVQWGYPYLFEEFRFHLSLSSNIDSPEERILMEREARCHFYKELLIDIPINGVSLFLEDRGKPMTQLQFFPFCG